MCSSDLGKDPYWAGAQAVVSAGIEGVLGTVQSVLEAKEGFRAAVDDFLGRETRAIDGAIAELASHSPFRQA